MAFLRTRRAETLTDNSSRIIGLVGIPDVERDILGANRKHCVLVKDGRTHVGELSQLCVRHARDALRIINYVRVDHEDAGHICPVLVHIGIQRGCGNRSGYVGATT